MKEIRLGIGFATGRRRFRNVLAAYLNTWNASKAAIAQDVKLSLHLFVAYDVEYNKTESTDYTNLSQEIVDTLDSITFVGAKNGLRSMESLKTSGAFTAAELGSVFGPGYAGKRNAILYAAIENHMDFLLFLDDDEYPMAVTNNHHVCLWSGQQVFLSHLKEIESADYTNGLHCGYISPIPQMTFNGVLREEDFRLFIEAISNDIVCWDTVRSLMASGGVTYASTEVLTGAVSEEVPLLGGCKFISGANLCINLRRPERSFPFFNPPGARGEDTFLSTMLSDRTVRRIPCYTFHDGFGICQHLLDGVLPIELSAITAGSPAVNTRFLKACIGWVRYKPLLVYLTEPDDYEQRMTALHDDLSRTIPSMAAYFGDKRFYAILSEMEKYAKNVKRHKRQFLLAQATWQKIIAAM